jgi:hypothetical protein
MPTTVTRCPHCGEELSRLEMLDGRCVNCGKDFPPAPSVMHGEPEESPYHPAANVREPMSYRQEAAVALLVLFLLAAVLPFGLARSCWLAFAKGDSVCARTGCTEEATKQVEVAGVRRGCCDAHAVDPAALGTKPAALPYALVLLSLLFAGYYFYAFKEAVAPRAPVDPEADPGHKAADPFRHFAWLTLIGVVGLNGFAWVASRYLC